MDDIEKRAREFLAVKYEERGHPGAAESVRSDDKQWWDVELAVSAIVAALSAAPQVPEDVMRDAERYRFLRRADAWEEEYINKQGAISAIFVSDGSRGHATDLERLDQAVDAAMLAAKPGPPK